MVLFDYTHTQTHTHTHTHTHTQFCLKCGQWLFQLLNHMHAMLSFEFSWAQLMTTVLVIALSVLIIHMRWTTFPRPQRVGIPQIPIMLPSELRQRIQTFRVPGHGIRRFRSAVHQVLKILVLKQSWSATGQWLNQLHIKDLTHHLARRQGRLVHISTVDIVRPVGGPITHGELVSFVRVSKWTPLGLRF